MSNIIDSIQLSGVTYAIQGSGGGKAIEAGRGISITTGETADTVSFNLPISAGTGTNSVIEGSTSNFARGNYAHAEGSNTKASGQYSHAEGYLSEARGEGSHAEGTSTSTKYYSHGEGSATFAVGNYSHAEGEGTTAATESSHAEGRYTITKNNAEHASGQFNNSVTASTTFGDSGNTLFSVGNGTSNSARHNAFEIRQNGDIYLSSGGTDIKLQDHLGGGGGNPTVELTQAEYDALVTAGTVSPTTYYIITDAQAGDLTQYWTSAQTNSAITQATSGKVDTSTYNTYTAATDTALASKQTTLTAGTGINITDNVISATGGGGGGKAIEAGRGISITTGETADTVSFDLPIYKTVSGTAYSLVLNPNLEPSANVFKTKYNTYINCVRPYVDNNSGSNNLIMGEACSAMSYASQSFVGGLNSKIGDNRTFAFGSHSEALAIGAVAFGYDAQAFKPQVSKGHGSFACGGGTSANTQYSFATGYHNFTTSRSEFASGQYNNSVSATTTFGDSGNTLFSVGNGTASNARHNAFEIRQNGDIYLSLNGQDVKLQDQLGGGSSYTAGDGIDITNDVISVTGKVDTSTYNTYTAATDTALASKQTTLTAGDGIDITNDVISVSGVSHNSLVDGRTMLLKGDATTIGQNYSNIRFDYYYGTSSNKNSITIKPLTINGNSALRTQALSISVVETSAITTAITSSSTDAQVPSAKAVNDKLGGLSLVKLTQAEYDALSPNYDSNTLYIVTDS